MSLIQERIQLRLEWWLQQILFRLQEQRNRVFNSDNTEFIYGYIESASSKVKNYIKSNTVLLRVIKGTKDTFLHVSRRVLSPLVRELGRNSLAAGGLGILIGMAISRLAINGIYHGYYLSPMKPQKMRGITCHESKDRKGYDGLEGLRFSDDLEAPRIVNPEQVLVRIVAASIDPADIAILSGLGWCERKQHVMSKSPNHKIPLVLGRDLSGIVVEVGTNVHHLNVGDTVWGSVPLLERGGTIADFVVLPGERLRRKPSNISHEGAATVPFAGIIAWTSLSHCGIFPNAAKGKTVLVIDATSSVGCIAVQLIRSWGGSVVSIVGHRHVAPLAQMLGSHQVVIAENDESLDSVKEELDGQTFDAILLTCTEQEGGTVSQEFCNKYLNKENKGVIVQATTPYRIPSDTYGFLRRTFVLPVVRLFANSPYMYSRKNDLYSKTILDELKQLVDSGKVQPVLDSTCDVTKYEDAFQRTATRATIGKAVVTFGVKL